jgi:hypothetical protein
MERVNNWIKRTDPAEDREVEQTLYLLGGVGSGLTAFKVGEELGAKIFRVEETRREKFLRRGLIIAGIALTLPLVARVTNEYASFLLRPDHVDL